MRRDRARKAWEITGDIEPTSPTRLAEQNALLDGLFQEPRLRRRFGARPDRARPALVQCGSGPNGAAILSHLPQVPDAPWPLVLFLCRSNTTRSIMAEAILRERGSAQLRAASAGDAPCREPVSLYALECLHRHGVTTSGLRSKPWVEFFGLQRPPVHFLITLCDVEAAKVGWESRNSRLVRAHWVMSDPLQVMGGELDIRLAFEEAFRILDSRIWKFLALPWAELTNHELSRELAHIGQEG